MTTRKYLENWLLWIVADGLAIYLFYQKQTPEYIILYVVYTLMAAYGFWNWNKKMNIKK
jgi:nicotinamide mononucleotide transporter